MPVSMPALKEPNVHGTKSFPCAIYRTNSDLRRETIVKHHWHDELEILHFKGGRFSLTVNMEKYDIRSECICFINPGELHSVACTEYEGAREEAVVFDAGIWGFTIDDDILLQIIQPLRSGTLALPRCITPDHAAFGPLLEQYRNADLAFQRWEKNNASSDEASVAEKLTCQMYIKSSLFHIAAILADHRLLIPTEKTRNRQEERLKAVLTYIQEHYSEKIFIRDLAEQININEQYFCRFFKKSIGSSPMAYVNDYRVKQSIRLLENTDRSVMDICLDCGFHNLGNYLREFRKYTGTTPAQYRRSAHR